MSEYVLLLEDGTPLLQEDGSALFSDQTIAPIFDPTTIFDPDIFDTEPRP